VVIYLQRRGEDLLSCAEVRPYLPICAQPPRTERTHRTSAEKHCKARPNGTFRVRGGGWNGQYALVADKVMTMRAMTPG
jgi:hypothetical protein